MDRTNGTYRNPRCHRADGKHRTNRFRWKRWTDGCDRSNRHDRSNRGYRTTRGYREYRGRWCNRSDRNNGCDRATGT